MYTGLLTERQTGFEAGDHTFCIFFSYNICSVSSDHVPVTSEEDIFKGIVKWVTHKQSERESNLAELFSQVRLKAISRKFLSNELVNEELVATIKETLNFVLKSIECIIDPFSEDAAKPPRKCLERNTDVIDVCGGRTALCYVPQKDIWYQLPDMLFEHQQHAVVQYEDKACLHFWTGCWTRKISSNRILSSFC